jgi:hypothetical protein
MCLATVGPANAEVTVLQNGVSPTPQYEGSTDTWISDEQWERNRNNAASPTMSMGGKRHVLIRFDLAPIPDEHVVHQAVLRLAHVGYPNKRKGVWPSVMSACVLTRPFQSDANWLEHTRTDYKEKDAGDWRTPGGEFDERTDFGGPGPGVIATDTMADGPWGHMHELDVTAAVKKWHSSHLPNHGLLLKGEHRNTIASSDWYVPKFRPQLIVAHGPHGSKPDSIGALSLASEQIELDPIALTEDRGQARGDYVAVCIGQNSNCAIRGTSTDAYVKEAIERFPGTWGWMNMSRVGGRAGDVSRTLVFFNLSDVPKTASIEKAVLHLTLTPYTNRQVRSYRYGAYLLRLPESPGWDAASMTSEECREGKLWPGNSVMAASRGKPVAIGTVAMKEIEQRGHKRTVPDTIEFDITGVVRAWMQGKVPNCGLALDNRIEGGAYDFYSSRSFYPERRPYLEISVSPAIRSRPTPVVAERALPAENYWIEPMRKVRKRFQGAPGTLAQYGDSITVTMAYLAPLAWGESMAPTNCSPEMRKKLDLIQAYANRRLWIDWKGGEWGNTGMMMSNWLINNIDGWQKKMNPEASVILFGTNDLGSIMPPEYTENMAASLRRMMVDGTVPMLTTVPPKSGRDEMVYDYWLAGLSIARGLKVPVIDYYAEIMRRRPDDWDGRLEKFSRYEGYQVPTLICRDGTHPSNPKEFSNNFSQQSLNSNGYTLRNYMTLETYAAVIEKVLPAPAKE